MEFANFGSSNTAKKESGSSVGLFDGFNDGGVFYKDYIGRKVVSVKEGETKRLIILASQISPTAAEGIAQFYVHENYLDDGSEYGHRSFALCLAENVDSEGNTKPCPLCNNKMNSTLCLFVPVLEEYTDKEGNIQYAKKVWVIRKQHRFKKQIESILEFLCEKNEKFGTVRGLGIALKRETSQSSKTGSIGFWSEDDENPQKIKRFTEEELIAQFGSDEVIEDGKVKYPKNWKITPYDLDFYNLETAAEYIDQIKGLPIKQYKG